MSPLNIKQTYNLMKIPIYNNTALNQRKSPAEIGRALIKGE